MFIKVDSLSLTGGHTYPAHFVALKKTLFRIYVISRWNRLHIIPAGRLAQSQVLSVRIPHYSWTVFCAYAATCAQVQIYIPGLSAHFGGEIAHLTFD